MQSDIPEDIQQYAEGAGLAQFKKFAAQSPAGFGFENSDEIQHVTLGPGFKVHALDAAKLKQASNSLIDVSVPTGEYEFIIYLNDEAKSFIRIQKTWPENRVTMAGGDASGAGTSLETIRKALPSDDKLVLISDRNSRYLAAKATDNEWNVPDTLPERSAVTGGMHNSKVWDSTKTIQFLINRQLSEGNPDADG